MQLISEYMPITDKTSGYQVKGRGCTPREREREIERNLKNDLSSPYFHSQSADRKVNIYLYICIHINNSE